MHFARVILIFPDFRLHSLPSTDSEVLSIICNVTGKKNLPKLNSQQDTILKKIIFLNETISVVAGPGGKCDKNF